MKALPEPVLGGSISNLRQFLNVRTENDFVLTVAWLLASLRGKGPFPVLAVAGEQGSAKSTFSAIVRALVDPNAAPLRALPRQDEELFIAANNGHVLAFDNISGALPSWTSDTLCRLATGGGFAKRQLYSDADETIFDACRRPSSMGSRISSVVPTSRTVRSSSCLKRSQRKPARPRRRFGETSRLNALAFSARCWTRFQRVWSGCRTRRSTSCREWRISLSGRRRAKSALWPAGTFIGAYTGNRAVAVDGVIDADPVASAVRSFARTNVRWEGTAAELLSALEDEVGEKVAKSKTWPGGANALSGRLRRAATFLRKAGVDIAFDRSENRARTRTIRITTQAANPAPDSPQNSASASSAPSGPTAVARENNDLRERPLDDPADDTDDPSAKIVQTIVRGNALKSQRLDDADDADDLLPALAGGGKKWSARI